MRVNWPRLYLGQELGQGRTSNSLPPMCLAEPVADVRLPRRFPIDDVADRKSTRLNSSHLVISYAVFCLKKKKKKTHLYINVLQQHANTATGLTCCYLADLLRC